jgi:6-phosphogluconolactonase (cycloisomerase 2 family)
MWVLGTQYNKIGGFRIDDRTGNLTGTVGSPYASGGTNPVMLTIQSGGRYLYVLNAGDSSGKTGNISLFSVGGDGTLVYQQSYTSIQGSFPVWITTDTTGNYLYVLSERAPDYDGVANFNGAITAYTLDPNTGYASPITNAQGNLPYFEVGSQPIQMRASSGCIYTLDSGDQTIFPSSLNSANGQLTTNPTLALNTTSATSVNLGGSFVYVTDAGSTTGAPGSIVTLNPGSSCGQLAVSGNVANLPTASDPVQTLSYTSGGNQYVYVLNHSTQNTNYANSSVSAFNVDSTGKLTPLAATVTANNPIGVGSGPVCMAIDPTNQYIYTSDQYSSTVTGNRLNAAFGTFSSLTHGSTFPTVGTPTCLVISKNTAY